MRRRERGWALAIPLALIAVYAIPPSGAFEHAAGGTRDVTAAVVADASAYNAVSGGACTLPSGGTCTFTITNKADTPQTYTVTLSEDLSSAVSAYDMGGTPVTSGPSSTTGEVAIAGTATLSATIAPCACGSRDVFWTIEGSKAGVLNSKELRYRMTIT